MPVLSPFICQYYSCFLRIFSDLSYFILSFYIFPYTSATARSLLHSYFIFSHSPLLFLHLHFTFPLQPQPVIISHFLFSHSPISFHIYFIVFLSQFSSLASARFLLHFSFHRFHPHFFSAAAPVPLHYYSFTFIPPQPQPDFSFTFHFIHFSLTAFPVATRASS